MSVSLMMCVDCVSLLLGSAILGVSVYAVVVYGYFSVLFSLTMLYISIGVGCMLIFLACFGFISASAADNHHTMCVLCYILLVAACLAANIAAVVLFDQLGGLVVTQSTLNSGALTDANSIQLNNAILSSYTACCIGCVSNECNNASPYFSTPRPNCLVNNISFCSPVPMCTGDPDQVGCFKDAGGLYPPVTIDVGICDVFSTLAWNNGTTSRALVGPVELGGCGSGDPVQYSDNILFFFGSQWIYVLIALGVLCGFQALNLFVACCVFATTK